ncbi:hypothetical protein NA57DRAFT_52662 [Rhizodiscina lignyota]|uniref:SnoaL-like domain-containing protein n=1 Tax=Rhizodiscina lignyota TaxID=1504668 RepID=A0A9P4IP69_9PEZI|nr:hypothetical protein NA57DRAFT_52662 [Rhizodiscina lignyota]
MLFSIAKPASLILFASASLAFPSKHGATKCPDQRAFDDFVKTLYVEKEVDAAFNKYVSPTFVNHDPNLPAGTTEQAFLNEIFPNVNITLERTLFQGDYGFVFIVVDGAPAPNDTSEIMDLWRIKDGKMQELWESLETLPAGFSI